MKTCLLLLCFLLGTSLSANPADKAEDYLSKKADKTEDYLSKKADKTGDYLSKKAEQADNLIDQTFSRLVYCWKKSMSHFHDGWNTVQGKAEDSLKQAKQTANELPEKVSK